MIWWILGVAGWLIIGGYVALGYLVSRDDGSLLKAALMTLGGPLTWLALWVKDWRLPE